MAKLIYLSPSNHGKNQNKCFKAGCYEDKHTRPIAEVCAKHLRANGFEVIVAKETQNMAARCVEANRVGAALYVPIHTNASSSAAARYLLFMFYADQPAYRQIFNAVAPHMEAIYPNGLKAHFSKRRDLYEINAPKAKTIYCELGFHTNRIDVDGFIHNAESVGKALAQGICKYFGVAFGNTNSGSGASHPANSVGTDTSGQGAGASVQLKRVPLYRTSTSKIPANYLTGTYYLWDNKPVKNRVKITNSKARVGVAGQVTGWIDKKHI